MFIWTFTLTDTITFQNTDLSWITRCLYRSYQIVFPLLPTNRVNLGIFCKCIVPKCRRTSIFGGGGSDFHLYKFRLNWKLMSVAFNLSITHSSYCIVSYHFDVTVIKVGLSWYLCISSLTELFQCFLLCPQMIRNITIFAKKVHFVC